MPKLVKEKGKTGRLHVESHLMGESLVSKKLLAHTEAKEYFRMHPDINIIKIGGQSIMDRGRRRSYRSWTFSSRQKISTRSC